MLPNKRDAGAAFLRAATEVDGVANFVFSANTKSLDVRLCTRATCCSLLAAHPACFLCWPGSKLIVP